jgi:PhoPQ-activated pathogenicity-related protein
VIEVKSATRPLAVVLWQAKNPETRDFRLEAIGPAYRRSALEPDGDGTYRARVPAPAHGWAADFVETTFASRGPFPFKFTTEVRVAPETLPFGPPPEMMSAKQEAAEISD